LWSKGFGGSSLSDSVIVNGVAADANGNVVITGQFSGRADLGGAVLTSAGGSDVFIAKFSSSGALLWSKRFGATSTDTGYGIGVDTSGNVLVIGIFQGTVDFGGGSLISAGDPTSSSPSTPPQELICGPSALAARATTWALG
jgi:hypothetical protein